MLDALKRATPWLLTSALVAAGAGGCHPCESAQIIRTVFASKATFAQQIDACTADSTACIALCADVMRIDPRDILRCEITSPVYEPTVPNTRSRTLPSMRGVNVRVDYNSFLVCALEDGVAVDVGDPFCNDGFCDGGGVDDGGGIDDGGDPGSTDSGGDTGNSGDSGDGGEDGGDGGGDGGGGDFTHIPPPTPIGIAHAPVR